MRKGELIKENEVLKRRIQTLEDTNKMLMNRNEFSHLIKLFTEGYQLAREAEIVTNPDEYLEYLSRLVTLYRNHIFTEWERTTNKK